MVFETCSYTSNAGVTIAIGDTTYPAQNFEMKTYLKNDPVNKVQYPGRWPSYSYPEYMEIHMAGDILGSSASDYNTKARALKAALNPPYKVYTGRKHGAVTFTFFGDATQYFAYVILSSLETPTEALYPSVGRYEITWISFEPYLVNGSTFVYATDL
jgi:hypothetical protein